MSQARHSVESARAAEAEQQPEGVAMLSDDVQAMTLFKFPVLIILAVFAMGCTCSDIAVDWQLPSQEAKRQYYAALAQAGPYNVTMLSFCLLACGVIVNLLFVSRFKLHDMVSLGVLVVLFGIRCTQLYPAIESVQRYSLMGDPTSLGRIPTQLRALRAFNLVQPVLLFMIALIQLYSYTVWITGEAAPAKPKKE